MLVVYPLSSLYNEFWLYHPFPQLLSYLPALNSCPTHPTVCPLIFSSIRSNFCCQYIHKYVSKLPRAMLWEKTSYPSPGSYQCAVTHKVVMRLHVHLPSPCWDLGCLELVQILCMLSQPQGRHCCLVSVHQHWLLPSFHTLFQEPTERTGYVRYACPTQGWVLYNLLSLP